MSYKSRFKFWRHFNWDSYHKTALRVHMSMNFFQSKWRIGNESVPKIIINDTINLILKTAISISVISAHNSFRVLFDKISSVYFILEIGLYLYFSIKMASLRNRHRFIGIPSFPAASRKLSFTTFLTICFSFFRNSFTVSGTFRYFEIVLKAPSHFIPCTDVKTSNLTLFYFHSPLYCCERFIITWTFRCENVNATQNSVLVIFCSVADGRTHWSIIGNSTNSGGFRGHWAGSSRPPPWATDRRRHGTPDKRQL